MKMLIASDFLALMAVSGFCSALLWWAAALCG
jgi:hypothetical protein